MKHLIIAILVTTLVGCGTFPMPPDKSEANLAIDMKLGKLNYVDIDKEPVSEENLKIYSLDQKTKNKVNATINNNITGSGNTYNITVIIHEAKAEVIKDEIASKTINLHSTITMEFLTENGKSNFESNIDYKFTIETANFKWDLVDAAYRRALSNAIHKGLDNIKEKV